MRLPADLVMQAHCQAQPARGAVASRCSQACFTHGSCNEELGRCDCLKGYQGLDCSMPMSSEEMLNASRVFNYRDEQDFKGYRLSCLNNCNGKGRCEYGVCHCHPGFYGADCALSLDEEGKPVLLSAGGYQPRVKRPLVYVYELPPTMTSWYNSRRVDRPLHLMFWQRLLSSGARTADGDSADWYFIPLRMRSAKDSEQLLHAITYIRNTWPWYNRTNGAFHFLFHLGDTGAAELSKPAAEGSQNLTWLSHWGLHEINDVAGWREAHVPGKDVVVPVLFASNQLKELGMRTSPLHPLHHEQQQQREHLMFFGGRVCGDRSSPDTSAWPACGTRHQGYSGQVRQKVFYHHYNRSGFVMTTRTNTWSSHVTTTRFCLAPPGGGHGYRQVLVSMLGCVPVVIGDYIEQPFQPELDWSYFAVQPSEDQIPQLHDILEAIDEEQLAAMRANLQCAAQHFSYSTITGGFMGETGKYDAFETTLEILRMKRLYPKASPYEYVDLDQDYTSFMACGQKGMVPLRAPVESVEVPGWGTLRMLGRPGGAKGAGEGSSGGKGGRRLSGHELPEGAVGLGVQGHPRIEQLGQGGRGLRGDSGTAAAAVDPNTGTGMDNAGARASNGVRVMHVASDAGQQQERQAKVCSYSKYDSPEASCRRCASTRGLSSAYGVPGGMMCCGVTNLAECPRAWA